MGGVSEGKLVFATEEGESFAHMVGRVSTENNGGFIQFRTSVTKGTTNSVRGVILKVRGNQQQYYIHLRSTGTLLPWQYYQAGFQTTDQWQTVKIPLKPLFLGKWLRKMIKTWIYPQYRRSRLWHATTAQISRCQKSAFIKTCRYTINSNFSSFPQRAGRINPAVARQMP